MLSVHSQHHLNNFLKKKNIFLLLIFSIFFEKKINIFLVKKKKQNFINLKSPFHYKLVKNHIYFEDHSAHLFYNIQKTKKKNVGVFREYINYYKCGVNYSYVTII